MKNIVKCVLFDLDGTLLSTGGAGIRALDRAFYALFQLPKAMRDINPAGKTDPAIIREIFRSTLGRECNRNEMVAVQEKYLKFLPEECIRAEDYRIMEGIPQLLQELRERQVLTGLGTGNLERGARTKLDRSGLNGYLPFGGFGSDSENRAELLKIGVRKARQYARTEIKSENFFVVGDTERDILAAQKSGLNMIAVSTGKSSVKTLKKYKPDFVLPDFENTEDFLNIIFDNGNGH